VFRGRYARCGGSDSGSDPAARDRQSTTVQIVQDSLFSPGINGRGTDSVIVKNILLRKVGSPKRNSRALFVDIVGRICAFFDEFGVSCGATICSGFKFSRKSYFFSHVFKGLTSKEFVTHCFYI
jgi:hypothetical protein